MSVVSPDQVSIGVLVDAVPRDAVDEAVAVCGVRERRSDGKLPAHVITYLTLGLCLFPDDDYEEVAAKVTGSLDRFGCWDAAWTVPTASAITQARKRLGREVFPELFERTCGPVAGDASPSAGLLALGTARGAFLRGWRLLAIDGFELDLPDTPANAAEFGYAGSGENRSAFPKARVVALAECGTHAFLAAEVDAYSVGEKTLAQRLYPRLRADELLTADRGFYSWTAWDTAAATGAALLWRAPTQLALPVVRVLEDGTYLTVVMDSAIRGTRRDRIVAAARAGHDLAEHPDAIGKLGLPAARLARVIEYDVPDRAGNGTGELICQSPQTVETRGELILWFRAGFAGALRAQLGRPRLPPSCPKGPQRHPMALVVKRQGPRDDPTRSARRSKSGSSSSRAGSRRGGWRADARQLDAPCLGRGARRSRRGHPARRSTR